VGRVQRSLRKGRHGRPGTPIYRSRTNARYLKGRRETWPRIPVEDSYVAATARKHTLTIATGNDRDFRRPGLKVFNPFKELRE
jgi:predicted nucleic acid-binding protein